MNVVRFDEKFKTESFDAYYNSEVIKNIKLNDYYRHIIYENRLIFGKENELRKHNQIFSCVYEIHYLNERKKHKNTFSKVIFYLSGLGLSLDTIKDFDIYTRENQTENQADSMIFVDIKTIDLMEIAESMSKKISKDVIFNVLFPFLYS